MTGGEPAFDEEGCLPGHHGCEESGSAAADAQLRELSLATEQIPTGIVITDPAYRIVYSNAMFRQITGFREAVIGLALTEILPEAPWQDLAATVRQGDIGGPTSFRNVAPARGFRPGQNRFSNIWYKCAFSLPMITRYILRRCACAYRRSIPTPRSWRR
jgi:PAS domain-containing protein